jgi:hypothetical protein
MAHWGFVAEYSGATAPESHGLPITGAKRGERLKDSAAGVNYGYASECGIVIDLLPFLSA